jgi:hypothetical protein
MSAPSPQPVDLLEQAIANARPMLRDGPTKARVRILWAAARAARQLAAEDQVHAAFMALAVEVGLIDRRGYWLGEDVRPDIGRHGRQDIAHVLTWALRNRNPFERL